MWTGILLLANTVFTLFNTYLTQRGNDKSRSTLINQAINQALHQVTNMLNSGQLQKEAASGMYFQIINNVLSGIQLSSAETNSAQQQISALIAARKMA